MKTFYLSFDRNGVYVPCKREDNSLAKALVAFASTRFDLGEGPLPPVAVFSRGYANMGEVMAYKVSMDACVELLEPAKETVDTACAIAARQMCLDLLRENGHHFSPTPPLSGDLIRCTKAVCDLARVYQQQSLAARHHAGAPEGHGDLWKSRFLALADLIRCYEKEASLSRGVDDENMDLYRQRLNHLLGFLVRCQKEQIDEASDLSRSPDNVRTLQTQVGQYAREAARLEELHKADVEVCGKLRWTVEDLQKKLGDRQIHSVSDEVYNEECRAHAKSLEEISQLKARLERMGASNTPQENRIQGLETELAMCRGGNKGLRDRLDRFREDYVKLNSEFLSWLPRSTPATRDVLLERRRQIEPEGWSAAHDDTHHTGGELAQAAACYARAAGGVWGAQQAWPWDKKWWKSTTPRRDAVKAAALLVAFIEQLDRKEATK